MQPPKSQPRLGHNGGPPLDDLLSMTIRTAIRITGFSKDTLYDLLAAGEIEGFLMGSRRYLTADSVRAYIARRAAEPLSIRRSPKPRAEPPREPRTGLQTGLEGTRVEGASRATGPPRSLGGTSLNDDDTPFISADSAAEPYLRKPIVA